MRRDAAAKGQKEGKKQKGAGEGLKWENVKLGRMTKILYA